LQNAAPGDPFLRIARLASPVPHPVRQSSERVKSTSVRGSPQYRS